MEPPPNNFDADARDLLPPEVRRTESAVGVYYRLPERRLGAGRWMGLAPLLFGLFSLALVLIWILMICQIVPGPWRVNLPWAAAILLLIVGALALLLAAVPVVIGVALFLPGHSEIILTKTALCAREVAGPLSWTFRRKRSALTALEVAWQKTTTPGMAESTRLDANMEGNGPAAPPPQTAILATTDSKQRRMLVAPGYPPALLAPLCAELILRCGLPDAPATSAPAPESPESPPGAPLP